MTLWEHCDNKTVTITYVTADSSSEPGPTAPDPDPVQTLLLSHACEH